MNTTAIPVDVAALEAECRRDWTPEFSSAQLRHIIAMTENSIKAMQPDDRAPPDNPSVAQALSEKRKLQFTAEKMIEARERRYAYGVAADIERAEGIAVIKSGTAEALAGETYHLIVRALREFGERREPSPAAI